jgi:NDP-sugar pyrophosphorylase family protein
MNGIILAAGLGKRLGRITRTTPKPLLRIGKKPILHLIIKKMRKAGIKNIGINLFYRAKEIKRFLRNYRNISTVTEKYLSGTGGAVLNFKDRVTKDFLVHNCDVVSDISIKRVLQVHKRKKPLATVVLVKNRRTDRVRVCVQKNRILRFYKKRMDGCYTYTGIAVLSKRIFKYFPKNKKVFSLPEAWNNAISNSEFLHAMVVRCAWHDIGTPDAFRRLSRPPSH